MADQDSEQASITPGADPVSLGREVSTFDPPRSKDEARLGVLNRLREGVADQTFRRWFRVLFVAGTLLVLGHLVITLNTVISKTLEVYTNTISAHATAALAKQAHGQSQTLSPDPRASNAQKAQPLATQQVSRTGIYGELRDALLPIVLMVSVLTAAIVVILVTAIKSSFAPPKADSDGAASDNTLPLPVIETLRSLTEAVVSLRK